MPGTDTTISKCGVIVCCDRVFEFAERHMENHIDTVDDPGVHRNNHT